MSFVSRAQQGYLHSHPDILGVKKLAEFDAATKGKHLPERKMHDGGTVPEDGSYKLEKGETVVPADKSSKYAAIRAKRKKGKNVSYTEVRKKN